MNSSTRSRPRSSSLRSKREEKYHAIICVFAGVTGAIDPSGNLVRVSPLNTGSAGEGNGRPTSVWLEPVIPTEASCPGDMYRGLPVGVSLEDSARIARGAPDDIVWLDKFRWRDSNPRLSRASSAAW